MHLETEPYPLYLHARITGEFEAALTGGLLAQAFAACRAARHRRLLLDASQLAGSLSIMDRYKLGMETVEHLREIVVRQPGTQLRIAVVASASLFDPGRFAEGVVSNRGGDLRSFDELAPAIAWLCGP